MKRMLAVLVALVAAFAVAAPAQASITDAQAANAVITWTKADSNTAYYAWFWGTMGWLPCPQGSPGPCWSQDSSTWNNLNRTGPNTVWVTANHFATSANIAPMRTYRNGWRARAYACGTSVCVDNKAQVETPVFIY